MLLPTLKEQCVILCQDFRESAHEIPDNSISLIMADPPYLKEFVEIYGAIGQVGQRVLEPSTFAVFYAGDAHLPDVFASLKGSGLSWYTRLTRTDEWHRPLLREHAL